MEKPASDVLLDSSPRSPTAPSSWPPEPEERRSRAPEFYGFVAWTTTYLLFVLYILWALLPDEWIVWLGVTWYPNRWIELALIFVSIMPDTSLISQWMGDFDSLVDDRRRPSNLYLILCHRAQSYSCLQWNECSHRSAHVRYRRVAVNLLSVLLDSRNALPSDEDRHYNPYFASAEPDAIPELYDIPIGVVNSVLYYDTLKKARARDSQIPEWPSRLTHGRRRATLLSDACSSIWSIKF